MNINRSLQSNIFQLQQQPRIQQQIQQNKMDADGDNDGDKVNDLDVNQKAKTPNMSGSKIDFYA